MKIIIYLFVFAVLVGSISAEYHSNKIVIKFSEDSDAYFEWIANNRTGSIEVLNNLLGEHDSRPYIRNELIKKIGEKKSTDRSLSSLLYISPLQRIAILSYSATIDPVLISKKISALPDFEYAEPMPIHRIVGRPNDPKLNGQYYIDSINAIEAWKYVDSTKSVVIAIVDTGIDFEHDDLSDNMFINFGEYGLDSFGNDKRSNGIDDDENGFIDDWRGWDFVSSTDSSGQDNDPSPGHKHGTHVGGTAGAVVNNKIGIAGVGNFVKILPVKVSGDNSLGTNVSHGYEGLLYAAAMGADVINNSWGSSSRSEAEQEVINEALNLGAVIVAAAGNNNRYEAFYPASYNGVVSVAALNSANEKAYFSNYSEFVDISAPGEDILSTIPDNSYEFMSGTSMASPVVAGVAALARLANPSFDPLQIRELLRVTADNVDDVNKTYIGRIGRGRVNALRAVTTREAKSVRMLSYYVTDENHDGVLDAGEQFSISASFKNILSDVNKISVKLEVESYLPFEVISDSSYLGAMLTGDTISIDGEFIFRIPEDITNDFVMKTFVNIYEGNEIINTETIILYLNPSYRTISENNISTTINSRGNIGFNDYPSNTQGVGFKYKNSDNINFEGALLIGSGYNRISNVARGVNQNFADKDFLSYNILQLNHSGETADLEANTEFADNNDSNRAGVYVLQHVYQFNTEEAKDIIFVAYDVINQTQEFRDSIFVGLFFDWDIGPSGADNQAEYDSGGQFGYVRNVANDSLSIAAVKLLSSYPVNYYAIDNGGTSEENSINVYDGFSRREKWQAMSNGISRKQSGITDASMVIAAGPIKMFAGDTTRVSFAIISGYGLDKIRTSCNQAIALADNYKIISSPTIIPSRNIISKIYPNPNYGKSVSIDYIIVNQEPVSLDIFDLSGRKVHSIHRNDNLLQGRYTIEINPVLLGSGLFFAVLKTDKHSYTSMFIITN